MTTKIRAVRRDAMSDHTPGPWTYIPRHICEGEPEVRAPEGWLICCTASDEDAQLIAAAPAWKARAEAAEAIWSDPIALHANLLRTGVLTREQALHLAGATDYDTLKARAEAAEADLRIANRGGLDLLYAIREAIGWADKHPLSLLPEECRRLKAASGTKRGQNAPIWPSKGYDYSKPGGFDGPTGAD